MALDKTETFECTWPSHVEWEEMMEDGHHMWGRYRLPLLHQLMHRARQIVGGELTYQRWQLEDEPYAIWMDLCEFNPGLLELGGKIGPSHHVEWWIRYGERGDPDSHGFSGPWMSPEFALASLIAHCAEHHREQLEETLTVTGGIA